jgi:iron complex outermembrane receptor protein
MKRDAAQGVNRFRQVALYGCTAMIAAVPAHAAESPAAAATAQPARSGIEEVIVTARKQEESAQVVPVSITAMSPADLQKEAVLSVQDLMSSVPGLFITTVPSLGGVTFAIRAAKSDNGTSDTVTAYIGDMPVASSIAIAKMVYDMQSISVLKGPQGTLFGANSTGGAIIFRPNMPSGEQEGYAQVGIGNYNRLSFQGMVNIPVNDVFQMRIAGEVVDQDKGFQKNITPNLNGASEVGTDKHESLRVGFRLKPSSDWQNDLLIDYYHQDDRQKQFSLRALRAPYSNAGGIVNYSLGGPYEMNNPFKEAFNAPIWNKVKIWDMIDTLTHEISEQVSLKAVLGFQDVRVDTSQDSDGTPYPLVGGYQKYYAKQWTFEPSVDVKSADGRLRNKTGLYFSLLKREEGNSYTVNGMPFQNATGTALLPGIYGGGGNFPVQSNSDYRREFRSHAIYSQFSYDLSKELTATLGLRYTWDTAKYSASPRQGFHMVNGVVSDVGGAYANSFTTGLCAGSILRYDSGSLSPCIGYREIKSQAPSFNFTLENRYAENSMLYATLRGGYLVGGFNNNVSAREGQVFKPEHVVDFETGIKSDWELWGRPIRTNFDVFYGSYKDQQRVQNGSSLDPVNGGIITYTAVQNAGASTFYGLDLDVTYEVTDNLEVSATWNHMESEYTNFKAPLNIPGVTAYVDVSGRPLSQAPQDVVNLSATVRWPLASDTGRVSSTLSWYWTDKTQVRDSPTFACTPNAAGQCFGPSSAAVDFRSGDLMPAFDLWNFTTSWKGIMGSDFDADFWIKNLMDKKYFTFPQNQMLSFGYQVANYGLPRTFGLNVRYNF